eukprot:CAMPEP_0204296242 /NCGR_PEP_ID=MMETSP0468-20130131/71123_1 /ASSEMBLY_ACC=CAM_ASM_000383 /TAXON_ID=2969 /ORGANISM="Oxyrrhis marina" /LENGTH=62 /DNA_ID=CAMNT_0051274927 /DNA_START=125 /DNA_END=313 /DNA_ORIENTATION=+
MAEDTTSAGTGGKLEIRHNMASSGAKTEIDATAANQASHLRKVVAEDHPCTAATPMTVNTMV